MRFKSYYTKLKTNNDPQLRRTFGGIDLSVMMSDGNNLCKMNFLKSTQSTIYNIHDDIYIVIKYSELWYVISERHPFFNFDMIQVELPTSQSFQAERYVSALLSKEINRKLEDLRGL